jgi:signal transduction histidine kinase
MAELEITETPRLTAAERAIVEAHSLLNCYRILHEDLNAAARAAPQSPGVFAEAQAACTRRIGHLADPAAARNDAEQVQDFNSTVNTALRTAAPTDRSRSREWDQIRSRLEGALWVLQVRSREFASRTANVSHTASVSPAELAADFQEMLRAIEEHSGQRSRFVYNLARQRPGDTYVDLRFEAERGQLITLPVVLKDVMRDLLANARKFTPPGGQLRLSLFAGSEGLHVVVEDNGRGIPTAELTTVTQFGQRGSNVGDIRSRGAGCGLTKALLVARENGGRFWISSREHHGTRIRIWLPPKPIATV